MHVPERSKQRKSATARYIQVDGFPLHRAQSREWERMSFRDVTKARERSKRSWNKQSGSKG